MTLTPSFPDTEDMYDIPGTPLMALSRVVTTAFTLVSALAPVYLVVTFTSGGAMSGNWLTGICSKAIIPSKVIRIEITSESTGLRINS
jgi:hypothetical protein